MKLVNSLSVAVLVMLLATGISMAQSGAMNKIKGQVSGNGGLSGNVKSFVNAKLVPTLSNSVFVKATEAQNAKKMSLADIQKTDKAWIAAEDELPIQKEVTSNACAQELAKVVKSVGNILEAFVMDNQGAVVCEFGLTSDYWQGDEAKWKNSFNGGKGGVDVGKVKFDKSANANLQQVSLPVFNAKGGVIGAVTFGISVDKL